MVEIIQKIIILVGYDKYTCVLLIYGWCHYFYEVFIIFVFGCPELKPSRVNNIGALGDNPAGLQHFTVLYLDSL